MKEAALNRNNHSKRIEIVIKNTKTNTTTVCTSIRKPAISIN